MQPSAVFFLHTFDGLGAPRVDPGLALGSQTTELEAVLAALKRGETPRLRFFFGYSGWAAGQLEGEVRAGGWLIRPAELDDVFNEDVASFWGKLLGGFGGDLGILGGMPEHPELN